MSQIDQIRRMASLLPQVEIDETSDPPTLSVAGKGLAWPYLARSSPKARRERVPGVLAVRCALERKELLIEAAPEIFFDDAHYRGYPAVLVRLAVVDEAELAALLEAAWRIQAPKALVRRFDGER